MWHGSWMLVLLVLCAPGDATSGSNCGPAMPSLSSVSDRQKAENSHRQHLEALFNRYGENGSISLAGLRRLLQNLGLDRLRTLNINHHEKPGHHHHGHHHHGHHSDHKTHHHHHHNHTNQILVGDHSHDDHSDHDHDHSHDDHSDHDHSHDDHSDHGHSHDDHSDHGHSHDDHSDHGHSHDDHSDHDHSHDDHSDHDHSHDNHNDHGHIHDDHSDHDHSHDDHSDHDHSHDDHSDHDHDNHGHNDHGHDDHGDHDHDDQGHNNHSHDDHSDHDNHGHNDHDHDDHSDHDNNNHKDHHHDNSSNNKAQDQTTLNRNSVGEKGKDEFEKNKVPETTTATEARRVRREEPTSTQRLISLLKVRGLADPHQHEADEEVPTLDSTQCLNASVLLSAHAMAPEVGLSAGDFSLLCPALLDQLDLGACVQHAEPTSKQPRHHHGNHSEELSEAGAGESRNIIIAWVGGFISISVISLLSLLGVVLIPLMDRVFFNFLLSFLVALAVGTLSGDAFLHLIPHSQVGHHHHHPLSSDGLHSDHGDHADHWDHADHGDHGDHGEEDNLDGVWKGLTALAGVYFMFLIEHFLTLGKMYKDKKNKSRKKAALQDKAYPEKQAALEENLLKPSEEVEAALPAGMAEEEQVMLTPTPAAQGLSSQGYSEQDCENKCHSHFHDTVGQPSREHHHHHDYHHILHHHHSQNHHPHSHTHSHGLSRLQGAGITSLAWMVVMGDGLHNFSDGLAIGAAFSEGLSSGLSTSVAVFCHELPHELGDFAVLLKAGMTVRQAILYNVLSAMMAYLGMVIGILIGHYAENVSMWIFALTAGLFMYVALVDMMPEMLHNDAGEHGFSHWGFFFLQNAGILLGFTIMLLIAVFEHRIRLDLGD